MGSQNKEHLLYNLTRHTASAKFILTPAISVNNNVEIKLRKKTPNFINKLPMNRTLNSQVYLATFPDAALSNSISSLYTYLPLLPPRNTRFPTGARRPNGPPRYLSPFTRANIDYCKKHGGTKY